MRIVVVGCSGAGKTTLATALARRLRIPLVELDAMYWGSHWTPVPNDVFVRRVDAATQDASWIVDGDYKASRDLVRSRAQIVVWLDLPLTVVFWRALKRTLWRLFTRARLHGGSTETWLGVLAPNWIPWWVLRHHRRLRRETRDWLNGADNEHLCLLAVHRDISVDALLTTLNGLASPHQTAATPHRWCQPRPGVLE